MQANDSIHVVTGFIRPSRLEAVADALRRLSSCPGMSHSAVDGFGGARPRPDVRTADKAGLEAMMRIEVFCRGSQLGEVIATIQAAARTGGRGDGMIFAADVAWAVNIRTNEVGAAALGEAERAAARG